MSEFLLINLLNKFPKEMEYLFSLDNNLIEDILKQAKEMENENLESAWNSSEQNMRFKFSSSAYKGITFKQWFEQFKKK